MSLDAFYPQGNSQLIAATTTASAAIQPSTGNITGFRVRTSALAYMAVSVSSAVVALAPTTGTPANGIWLTNAVAEKFNGGPNCWLSFITSAAAGALVNVTPGFGS